MKLGKGKKIYAIRLIFLYFNLTGNFFCFLSQQLPLAFYSFSGLKVSEMAK